MRNALAAVRALFIAFAWVAAGAAHAQPRFEVLGDFWPAGVSDDGNVVAGTWVDPSLDRGQVMSIWTPAGGLRTAGFVPESEHTSARAISGDGATIVGVDYNVSPLYWTAAGGIARLSSDGGGVLGYPGGTSRDGSVITGRFVGGPPARWTTAGGAAALPMPDGWVDGHGNAVSADGSVVAGALFDAPGHRRAFRWTHAGGTQLLEHAPAIRGSEALAVSDDGATVVGWSYDAADGDHAFRWTAAGGFQLLGHLGDPGEPTAAISSRANDVTADGAVVVGAESFGPLLGEGGAFIWDEARGMRSLEAVLANDYGLDMTGWTLWSADGITPDGVTIIGSGSHPQFGDSVAWRVVLPEPAAGATLVAFCCAALRRRRRAAA